ncbi:Uncharacterized protein APZ42_013201 [Daphnia magna]|uniref:Uncharacterized protein n=1 Tax=Daphnia magna TaxID=35525 RepID=A0A162CH23_9CRUS|nr:Uncharacterized protein APZ42_013201 [Daphnia magna]
MVPSTLGPPILRVNSRLGHGRPIKRVIHVQSTRNHRCMCTQSLRLEFANILSTPDEKSNEILVLRL